MDDPEFGRWFVRLRDDLRTIASDGSDRPLERAVLGQRALIELIDFLDPGRLRFSDRNERGKIPLPPGLADITRRRRPHEVARFTVTADDADRALIVGRSATDRGLALMRDGDEVTIALGRRPWQRGAGCAGSGGVVLDGGVGRPLLRSACRGLCG